MSRLVVLASWDADDEMQVAEIRVTLEPLGADIQVLRFEGDALVGVDPAPDATAAEQDPKHAAAIALIRQLPARPGLSPGWQDRVLATRDEATTRVYNSARGLPLLLIEEPADVPVLTVELYQKWYTLHVVHVDGQICEVGFDELDDVAGRHDLTPYCDHAPNPVAVQRLAVERGWHLDPNALEMIIGRWEIEACNRYGEDE